MLAPGTYLMNFAWWDRKVSRKWHEEEHPLDGEAEETAADNRPGDLEAGKTPESPDHDPWGLS